MILLLLLFPKARSIFLLATHREKHLGIYIINPFLCITPMHIFFTPNVPSVRFENSLIKNPVYRRCLQRSRAFLDDRLLTCRYGRVRNFVGRNALKKPTYTNYTYCFGRPEQSRASCVVHKCGQHSRMYGYAQMRSYGYRLWGSCCRTRILCVFNGISCVFSPAFSHFIIRTRIAWKIIK